MGLFDRLFGRKEEPQIEDVVKEALENLDLTEDAEEVATAADLEEETTVENQEQPTSEPEVTNVEAQEDSLVENHESIDLSTNAEQAEPVAEALENISEEGYQSDHVEEPVENLAETAEFSAEEISTVESNEEQTEAESPVEAGVEEQESNANQPSAMEAYYAELQARIAEASARNQASASPERPVEDPVEKITEPAESAVEKEEPVQETVQEKYDRSLKKTRSGFGARLNAFFANFRSVDEEFFEELEELLILSDVGVQVASNLTEELRYEAKLENAKKPEALRRVIIEKLVDLYEKDGNYNESINFQEGLTVMLFVGVNGVGKTTSIGKLAHKYKQEGKKVMLVAADTFRAGAVAQLAEWGRRVDVPVVTGPEKSDPASVVYDGMERAVAEGVDILMIDTAGRLQNKDNLMAELEKIGRIIKRVLPEAPHETFLALDASTGQNALVQAKEFSKITPVTGIVLTKIDGTARGGVVLAIREELDIPVKLIGFGEKIDDIGEFNSENFMKGLLEGLL